ncbi:hypothetical protein SBV1_160019 [Verrucomicrobia bacterium]|nr:hypothetical protein SBV1_160019 [Verrucomicrobiota bacterium]
MVLYRADPVVGVARAIRGDGASFPEVLLLVLALKHDRDHGLAIIPRPAQRPELDFIVPVAIPHPPGRKPGRNAQKSKDRTVSAKTPKAEMADTEHSPDSIG